MRGRSHVRQVHKGREREYESHGLTDPSSQTHNRHAQCQSTRRSSVALKVRVIADLTSSGAALGRHFVSSYTRGNRWPQRICPLHDTSSLGRVSSPRCYHGTKANHQYINCATGNILNHASLCYWIRRIDSASIMLLNAKFSQQYTIVLLEAKATQQWANQQYTDCATGREVYSTVHHCATEGKVHKGTLTSALSVPGTTKASESRRPRDLRGGCRRDTRVRNAISLPVLAVPPIVD